MSTTSRSQSPGRATLLDLPLDMREQVYHHVFSGSVVEVNTQGVSAPLPPQCLTLAVAQTCTLLRTEALPRFHRSVVFVFGFKADVQALVRMEAEQCSKGELDRNKEGGDEKSSCKARLISAVREVAKLMHHINIDYENLPVIGWDLRTWTWTGTVDNVFPRLRKLDVSFPFSGCDCEDRPLLYKFDPVTGRAAGFPWQQRDQYPPTIEDGEFMCRLWRCTASRRFSITFDVWVHEGCGASGTTNFTVDLCRKSQVELVTWFNYHTTNDRTVRLLTEFGLRNAAAEMQAMIDQAAPELDKKEMPMNSSLAPDVLDDILRAGVEVSRDATMGRYGPGGLELP